MQAKPLLRGVVLLMLPGLCRSLFAKRQELLPGMAALLGKPAVVTAPSATIHPGAQAVVLSPSRSWTCPVFSTVRMHAPTVPGLLRIAVHTC